MNLNILNSFDLEHGGILVIMVGPPGSGKTTIAEKIKNEFTNFVVVSPDKIRKEMLGDSLDQSQNDMVFSQVYDDLVTYLYEGKNVVYDATNCRSIYRHKIINACKDYAYSIICLVSGTPIYDCIRRNNDRGNTVPEDVIERMYFTLKKHPPIIFEGYDLIARF